MHATSIRGLERSGGIPTLLVFASATLVHLLATGNRAVLAAALLALPLPAQVSWRRHQPAEAPLARWLHAMAHDSARSRTLLFGGWDGALTTVFPDMWEWDGQTWARLQPSPIPSPRCGHALAFDSLRKRTLLYGGRGAATLDDTWEWDGAVWQRLSPAVSPPPRWTPALAYDPANRNSILFGGWDEARQAALDETWTWEGTTWTRHAPAVRPKGRFYHALAGDGRRGRVVLFGGVDPGPPYAYLGDTWEWDGAAWSEMRPVVSPPAMARHALAFDEFRGRVILHGGNLEGWALQPDTWEWDGASWHRRAPAGPLPPAGVCPALAYDPARRSTLLFGGLGNLPQSAHSETWEYASLSPAAFAAFGTACPPAAPLLLQPLPGALPWIGESFGMRAEPLGGTSAALGFLGTSDSSWAGLPLPFGLGLIGFPACRIHVSAEICVSLSVQAGGAEWLLAIPGDHSLAGLLFYTQVLALDGGLLSASAGGRAVVGRK